MRSDIKALTGVRGVAAIYVCLYHFSYEGGLGPRLARRFLGHGYLAVDLFFVLSGFVMALTYARLFQGGASLLDYRAFLWRRVARIYPLYIVMTLLCAAVAYAGCNGQWPGWKAVLLQLACNAALVQSLHCSLSIDLPAWSISAEMIAYVMFPLLCAAALCGGWRRQVGIAIACAAMLAALSLVPSSWLPPGHRDARRAWMDLADGRTLYPVARCLAEFTLGLVMWRAAGGPIGDLLRRRRWTGDLLAAGLLVALVLRNDDTLIAVLFAALILCLATDQSLVTRAMGCRVAVSLGVISYSVYLVHTPVRDLTEAALSRWPGAMPGGRPVITGAEMAVVLAVSWFTYACVEKPCAQALRGQWGRLRPGPGLQAACGSGMLLRHTGRHYGEEG